MSPRRFARRFHKWLAIVVGLQLVLWTVSGLYMVVVDLDIIHGDMLVKEVHHHVDSSLENVLPPSEVLDGRGPVVEFELVSRLGQPVYLLTELNQQRKAVHALSGETLSTLTAAEASEAARQNYVGRRPVASTELITGTAPSEIGSLPLPVWQVNFDDVWGSSFYIDPVSGEFLKRRHTLWRVFDFFWMLHIMDYEARTDINNLLLRLFASLALLMGLSGTWLLYYRFSRKGAG